jgi:hypothetical protein
MEGKKIGFFDLKRNLIGVLAVIAVITIAGLYFGFKWNDVGDVAESAITAVKPNLPIQVGYRKSLIGKGYVSIIQNKSKQPLALEIDLRDRNANNKKMERKTLAPNQKIEIGWVQGWEFESGDVIKISNPNYQIGVYEIK